MLILAVGDVVGQIGCDFINKGLRSYKRFKGIDLCIINGENSASGNGVTKKSAEELFNAGADVITTGNHVWQRREVYDYLDECPYIIRPYNFYSACPGKGYVIVEVGQTKVMVGNLSGCVYLDLAENPFIAADRLLKEIPSDINVKIIDFHAEVTSEKIALAHYLDGRLSVLFGTHTHVQTADEQIFEKGLGYITDIGMTGPQRSVLGLDPVNVIQKFITQMPQKFETSQNPVLLSGAIFEVDDKTGKTISVERINISGF